MKKYEFILLFISIIFLAACSSMQNRYRSQNFLSIESAECTFESGVVLGSNNSLVKTKEPQEQGRHVFYLAGLSRDEAVETYCGPFCESGKSHKLQIGARLNDKEMFLTNKTGDETIRLDLQNKRYERILFSSTDKKVLERGSCKFTSLK